MLLIVAGVYHRDDALALVHLEPRRQIYAEHGRLAVLKVGYARLVHLLLIGEKQQLRAVRGLEAHCQPVAVLVLLLAAHAQRLRGYLLEVALAREEERHGVVLDLLVLVRLLELGCVDDAGFPRRAVLLGYRLELVDDDRLELAAVVDDRFQLLNVALEFLRLGGALEDIFAVYVAQLDLRDELRLRLVYPEAHHQVRHDLALKLGVADDVYRAVDVEQYPLKTLEQVQLLLLLAEVEEHAAADALDAPRRPLFEYLAHAHHARVARNEDVEVAGERVLKRRHAEELLHELVGVCSALEVYRQAQTAQVGLVAHVVYLAYLPRLYKLRDLVDDRFRGRGIRNFVYLYYVLFLDIAPARPHLEAAAPRAVDVLHLRAVVDDLAPGGEVRCRHGREQVMLRVAQPRDRRVADLGEVKAAYLACHADRDAHVRRHQHVRERRRQERGLLHAPVVVVCEVDRVLVNVAEELRAYR